MQTKYYLHEEVDIMKIKEIIYNNRKKINYTQQELADKLNVSSKTISNWERGISYPDILIVPKLCETLNISINQLYDVDDIVEIDGKIEYDEKQIGSFRTKMIISILLLFVPILVFLGTLLSSRLIFNLFVVLGSIGYIVSFGLSISSSINIFNYIKNNRYSKKYIDTLKKYNLIYYAIIFTLLNMLVLLINNNIVIVFISIILTILFSLVPIIITKKTGLKYIVKDKLIYLVPAVIFLMLNISLLIARQTIIFNFQYIIMSLPVYLFYGSFLSISHN